jgi:hypothetical protein
MIEIKTDNHFYNQNTFISEEKLQEFRKKYKHIDHAKLTVYDKTRTGTNLVYDLIKAERLIDIVKDFGSEISLSVRFEERDDLFNIRQMPGMCGAVFIYFTNICGYSLDKVRFVEDLLYLMGFTVLFISERAQKKCYDGDTITDGSVVLTRIGFNQYMKIPNRRTKNDIILYYKQLNFTP